MGDKQFENEIQKSSCIYTSLKKRTKWASKMGQQAKALATEADDPGCPLVSTYMLWHSCARACTHTHRGNKNIIKNFKGKFLIPVTLYSKQNRPNPGAS